MQVVILVGLPGSGKSTFHAERFAATHVHVSRDNFPNNRQPSRRQATLIEEALTAGRDVVVDNTNLRAADRAPIIEAARRHGATVVGYFFEPDVAASRARNKKREGRARVPDVAIYAARKRLEPPTREEGFDVLIGVRNRDDAGFELEDAPVATAKG
jgi:predicted kinase